MAMNPSRSRFWQTRSLDSLRTAYCTWLDRKNRLLRRLQPLFWHGAHPVASHPIARQPEHPGTPWHTGGTGGVPEHIGAESPESHNAPGFSAIGGGRLGLEQWNTPRAKAGGRRRERLPVCEWAVAAGMLVVAYIFLSKNLMK
jgi:hypothetical protein